jgi:hypothetical protein
MVKSGELAKYGLATIAKMLETLGSHVLVGYDIGCSFTATVLNSALATLFQSKGFRLCTDVFHGYAHNYRCQLRNHPYGIVGAGLEDLGTMERVFAASNFLSRVTRYASPYMRHLLIDIYFTQWDEDKFAATGKMIYENYIQALETLELDRPALEEALILMGLTKDNLEDLRKDEAQYLEQLKSHEVYDRRAVTYVRLLLRLQKAEDAFDTAHSSTIRLLTAEDFVGQSQRDQYNRGRSEAQRQETQRRHSEEALDAARHQVIELEVELGIALGERWTPNDPMYREALQHIVNEEYYEALEDLERLVVQRLFELQKLNISQTGMFSCILLNAHDFLDLISFARVSDEAADLS